MAHRFDPVRLSLSPRERQTVTSNLYVNMINDRKMRDIEVATGGRPGGGFSATWHHRATRMRRRRDFGPDLHKYRQDLRDFFGRPGFWRSAHLPKSRPELEGITTTPWLVAGGSAGPLDVRVTPYPKNKLKAAT